MELLSVRATAGSTQRWLEYPDSREQSRCCTKPEAQMVSKRREQSGSCIIHPSFHLHYSNHSRLCPSFSCFMQSGRCPTRNLCALPFQNHSKTKTTDFCMYVQSSLKAASEISLPTSHLEASDCS